MYWIFRRVQEKTGEWSWGASQLILVSTYTFPSILSIVLWVSLPETMTCSPCNLILIWLHPTVQWCLILLSSLSHLPIVLWWWFLLIGHPLMTKVLISHLPMTNLLSNTWWLRVEKLNISDFSPLQSQWYSYNIVSTYRKEAFAKSCKDIVEYIKVTSVKNAKKTRLIMFRQCFL